MSILTFGLGGGFELGDVRFSQIKDAELQNRVLEGAVETPVIDVELKKPILDAEITIPILEAEVEDDC